MNLVIRRLAPEEWQTYRQVRLTALRDSPSAFCATLGQSEAYPEQTWRDWCTQPSWFAFVDDEPVGMARTFRDEHRDLPILVSMWVSPAVRGTSVATDLVRCVVDQARADGDDGVLLDVIDTNARARALYERMGFTETGAREQLPDGRVEVRMELMFA
ncbi:GNAT family N-acetyltransferase [Mobilicoccus massiliensis]|uniref:GNAT family N-acetyltransferase n=1 Tax=Mobilicoccus massiliensis TaxID=1522310 RepID=UPI000693CF8D|nr:GNAT family N-acetyltransferase [Mobilicoccus massiliensis]